VPGRLPQSPPFRFVDRVLEADPPRRAEVDGYPVARLTVLIRRD